MIVCVTICNTGYPRRVWTPTAATGNLPEFGHHCSGAVMGGLLFEEENPCSAQSSGMYRGITAHCVRVCMCVSSITCVFVCMQKQKKGTDFLPAKTKLIPKCLCASISKILGAKTCCQIT